MATGSPKKRRLYQTDNVDSAVRDHKNKESETNDHRINEAKAMINKAALASTPNGIIPVPLLNYSTLAYIQTRLIRRIGNLYDQEPNISDLNKITTVLFSCYLAEFLSSSSWIKTLRLLPGLGTLAGVGISSSLYYYSTKIIGEIFLQHFDSGGTILSFDPDQVKAYYSQSIQQSIKSDRG